MVRRAQQLLLVPLVTINNSVVVQDWYKSVPVQSTSTPDPYPHSNGGHTLGMHQSCPTILLHIFVEIIILVGKIKVVGCNLKLF